MEAEIPRRTRLRKPEMRERVIKVVNLKIQVVNLKMTKS